MNFRICLPFILFMMPLAGWAITGDATAGKAKTEICVTCHGPTGNSVNPEWPKIAGQHEGYLVKQITEIQKGDQGNRFVPTMVGMVAGLSQQDIADVAAYYAQEKQTGGEAKSEYVALGKQIYLGGNIKTGVPACLACHGPQGMGNSAANFPRLAGQHAAYTELQMDHFRKGERKNDPSGMMEAIAKRLTDEEIKAVSSYIEGLHE